MIGVTGYQIAGSGSQEAVKNMIVPRIAADATNFFCWGTDHIDLFLHQWNRLLHFVRRGMELAVKHTRKLRAELLSDHQLKITGGRHPPLRYRLFLPALPDGAGSRGGALPRGRG